MRRRTGTTWAGAIVMILCSIATASADISIETHLGDRPGGDGIPTHAMAVMQEILHRDGGVVVEPALVRAGLRHQARRAIADRSLTAEWLMSQFQLGFRAWLHGQVQEAATQFETTLRIADQNSGLVVQDPKLRAAKARALGGLAVSRSRLKDTKGAAAAMLELLRTFPGEHIGDNYGPEGDKLAAEVQKQLAGVELGKLTVDVNVAEATMFLDDLPVEAAGQPRSFSRDVLPGEHHVVVQVSTVPFRYDVMVKPKETTAVSIDWRIDYVLNPTPAWVGFELLGTRENELSMLQGLAKLVEPGTAIYAIGTRGASPRAYSVVGARYDVGEKRIVRSGEVHLDAQTDHEAQIQEKMHALARFLLDNQPSPIVVPVADAVKLESSEAIVQPRAMPAQAEPHGTRWPAWVAGGLGIAALVAAPVLIYLDERGTCGFHTAEDCRFVYGTGTAGWISLGAGVVSGAFSIYWYLHTRHAAPVDVSIAPAPSGAVASVGWTF